MAKTPREKLIPNSTQVPNVLMDLVMPRLPTGNHERVLRYICRRTFGFGKRSDRIGLMQFVRGIKSKEGHQLDYGAGVTYTTARRCLDDLCYSGLVQKVTGSNGRANGYRINLEVEPEIVTKRCLESFEKASVSRRSKAKQGRLFAQNNPAPQGNRVLPREQGTLSAAGNRPPAPQGNNTKQSRQNKGKQSTRGRLSSSAADKQGKTPSDHKQFIEYWHDLVKRVRGVETPIITKADARNLKRILESGVERDTLEQVALFFLADYAFKTFSPSISTLLSAGILNGLLNRIKNDPEFWKKLEGYSGMYLQKPKVFVPRPEVRDEGDYTSNVTSLQDALGEMVKNLAIAK